MKLKKIAGIGIIALIAVGSIGSFCYATEKEEAENTKPYGSITFCIGKTEFIRDWNMNIYETEDEIVKIGYDTTFINEDIGYAYSKDNECSLFIKNTDYAGTKYSEEDEVVKKSLMTSNPRCKIYYEFTR